MRPPRAFIPQAVLDAWLAEGHADLQGLELTLLEQGAAYRLVEGHRVLRQLAGAGDAHDLVGRVKTRAYLVGLGAELFDDSVVVDEAVYEAVPGWLAEDAAPASVPDDEALLARYLLGALG